MKQLDLRGGGCNVPIRFTNFLNFRTGWEKTTMTSKDWDYCVEVPVDDVRVFLCQDHKSGRMVVFKVQE